MTTGREYRFQVRSYECGPDGAATLPTICNYLQEAASLNAKRLAFSKSDFAAAGENLSWVLTRLRVKMARYPPVCAAGCAPKTHKRNDIKQNNEFKALP